ncbi:MAG: WecB/TagA/CpsF family glycosyltransferase [Candidatus Cloacimonetes bacterium]|nr:WecB/TagA/CpsF family glycosyltransferase [Candidatus Cloacimonadota bacterium]
MKANLCKIMQNTLKKLIPHLQQSTTSEFVNVFGIKICNISMPEALILIDEKISKQEKTPVYFVNADCMNKVYVDKEYYAVLKGTKVILPDGIGINLAGKMLGTPVRENVNGTDLLPLLCDLSVNRSYGLYLLGAAPKVAETMKEKLLLRYPKLNICGARDGFFDWRTEAERVIEEINQSKPDILLVALGAPLQEKFINRYGDSIDATIQMGVGGLFDFYSGRIARAPLWMRQIGLEWVFRLIQEPKRMWRRYILGNPLFLARVFRWKMHKDA